MSMSTANATNSCTRLACLASDRSDIGGANASSDVARREFVQVGALTD